MDSHLLGVEVGTGACARPPASPGTSRSVDHPPTHFFVKKKFSSIAQRLRRRKSRACSATLMPSAAQGVSHAQAGAFSLRKKRPAGIRLSAWQGRRKSVQTYPLFPSLKNNGIPKGRVPLAELEAEPRGLSPTPAGTGRGALRGRRTASRPG